MLEVDTLTRLCLYCLRFTFKLLMLLDIKISKVKNWREKSVRSKIEYTRQSQEKFAKKVKFCYSMLPFFSILH